MKILNKIKQLDKEVQIFTIGLGIALILLAIGFLYLATNLNNTQQTQEEDQTQILGDALENNQELIPRQSRVGSPVRGQINQNETTIEVAPDSSIEIQNQPNTTEEAIEFNDKIVNSQLDLIIPFIEYSQTIGIGENKLTKEEAIQQLNEFIFTTLEKKQQVQELTPVKGGEELKDKTLNWFDLWLEVMRKEYKEIIELRYIQNPSEQEKDRLVEITNQVIKMEEEVDAEFRTAQQELADFYGFTLTEQGLPQQN